MRLDYSFVVIVKRDGDYSSGSSLFSRFPDAKDFFIARPLCLGLLYVGCQKTPSESPCNHTDFIKGVLFMSGLWWGTLIGFSRMNLLPLGLSLLWGLCFRFLPPFICSPWRQGIMSDQPLQFPTFLHFLNPPLHKVKVLYLVPFDVVVCAILTSPLGTTIVTSSPFSISGLHVHV